jgi:leucyl/phenylalanyl-tRNA--protein transferase
VTGPFRQTSIALLDPDPLAPFPPVARALREPDGLLAIGGDLSPERLLNAYRLGIFPWYSEGQPLLWWSPDPRAVLRTDRVRMPAKFRRHLRRSAWSVLADTRFDQVVSACATVPRRGQSGTWITSAMARAYSRLHELGHAHSIETLDENGELVGGVYGVSIGRMFFGESMFSARSGGSRVALTALARRLQLWGWPWIDAQVGNEHTASLGSIAVPRPEFVGELDRLVRIGEPVGRWTDRFGRMPAADLAS